jgi:hypothetical protein
MLEKYLASNEVGKREMEFIYGEKVLKKLVEQFLREKENEEACHKYIRHNTVLTPQPPRAPFYPLFFVTWS